MNPCIANIIITRQTLLNTVERIINSNISKLSDDAWVNLLLYRSPTYTFKDIDKLIKVQLNLY